MLVSNLSIRAPQAIHCTIHESKLKHNSFWWPFKPRDFGHDPLAEIAPRQMVLGHVLA